MKKSKKKIVTLLLSIIILCNFLHATEWDIAIDTIGLKQISSLIDGRIISLQQLSAVNPNGGGLFIQLDSTYKEGIIAFDNPLPGKQWIRLEFLNENKLSVLWSGAYGDGQHEDAASIQKLIRLTEENSVKSINFPKGVYLIENTIELQSNLCLFGEAVLIAKRNNPVVNIDGEQQTTFYPTTILKIENISNITLDGLNFDGNWQANENNNYSSNLGVSNGTSEMYVANLLRLKNSNNIEICNCHIENYSSNWGGQLGTNGAICIENCNEILLRNTQFYDSRTEGIIFLNSEDIQIDRLITNNSSVWTPIHAWYCNGLIMSNSQIEQQLSNSGSTMNLTSSNVYISTTNFIGGAGIDIGNEAGVDFTLTNINIENCIIENNNFGIYSDNSLLDNSSFKNNNIKAGLEGIRLYNFTNSIIADNDITLLVEGTFGIKLAHNIENILIENNFVTADCGIQAKVEADGEFLSNIFIKNNTILALKLNSDDYEDDDRNSYQPYSSGIYFRKYGTPNDTYCQNIKISDNKIHSEGSWIYVVNDLGEQNCFTVSSNYCSSSSIGCQRGLQIGYSNNLILKDNILIDCWINTLVDNNNIDVLFNRILYENYTKSTTDGVGFMLKNNSGINNTQYNYMHDNIGVKPFFYTPSGYENSFNIILDTFNYSL